VAVKDGASPALVATAGLRESVPASKPEKIVDPTGAGDSFNGAYLAARVAGRDPVEAAKVAHRVAGIVIGHKGALVEPRLLG
jgi:2-dehydro-3-deoxygluconokinase